MNLKLHHRELRPPHLILIGTCLVAAAIAQADSLHGGALVSALRHGGYVLVMRHAHSPGASPVSGEAQPDNPSAERELDAAGRDSARAMGRAIRRLGIPIGQVESSPTYRARQTVKLAALSAPKIRSELGEGSGKDADADAGRAAWLRHRITQLPLADGNTFLVTHAPNMMQAFGKEASDIADGEALVFRPDGRGVAHLVARIKIQDWSELDRRNP